jgi:hypothetical protein
MEIGASGDRETKTIATRRNGGSGGRSGDQVIGKTKAYRGLARMSGSENSPQKCGEELTVVLTECSCTGFVLSPREQRTDSCTLCIGLLS